MGAVMVLSSDDAAKFWPIYSEYDAELTKLNNQRVENVKEYARTYDQMTDEKADELIKKWPTRRSAASYWRGRTRGSNKHWVRSRQPALRRWRTNSF